MFTVYRRETWLFSMHQSWTRVSRLWTSSGQLSPCRGSSNRAHQDHREQPSRQRCLHAVLITLQPKMIAHTPTPTPEAWSSRAISFFFWTHTVPSPAEHSSLGYFDFLEDYFQTDRPKYLLDALNAAALSCYAHFLPDVPHLGIDALSSRGRALQALTHVLRDAEEAKSDDVLLALYLIERSEVRQS